MVPDTSDSNERSVVGELREVHIFEQEATNLENSAKLVATYYQTLVKEGVPPALADEFTKFFHSLYWGERFGVLFTDSSLFFDDDLGSLEDGL